MIIDNRLPLWERLLIGSLLLLTLSSCNGPKGTVDCSDDQLWGIKQVGDTWIALGAKRVYGLYGTYNGAGFNGPYKLKSGECFQYSNSTLYYFSMKQLEVSNPALEGEFPDQMINQD